MKRFVAATMMAVIVSTGLVGCGAKEREELRTKVASLEQEASKMKNESAAKDATIADLRSQLDAANNNAKAAQDKAAALEGEVAQMKEAAMKKAPAKKK